MQSKTSSKSPDYVDMKDKDVSESVKKLSNLANGVVESSNISIDDNTASRTNTVSDSDMDAINKDTDTLLQDSIVEEEKNEKPSSDTNNEQGTIPKAKKNGSSDYKGMKNGTLYTILVLIVAILL